MNTAWTSHLTGDSKKEFERTIQGSTVALRRMKEILRQYESEIQRHELSLAAYDTPSWPAKQAHINGMRQAYQRVADLLAFIKD
jgi:uncharacterized protein YukE